MLHDMMCKLYNLLGKTLDLIGIGEDSVQVPFGP